MPLALCRAAWGVGLVTRVARARAESDIYHVIVRGAGRQVIFEDDADRLAFLDGLLSQMREAAAVLLAWCLMSNHAHLLMRAPLDVISSVMHDAESGYATRFNLRHGRVGALFQGRFRSVPIESDRQLLAAVRYIHRNPVEAGGPIDGPWSSYREYVGACKPGEPGVCDTRLVLDMLGGREGFVALHADDAPVDAYDAGEPHGRVSDARALQVARDMLGSVGLHEVKALDKPARNALLARLKAAGLPVRQIARLTGIGESIVTRAK